MRKVFLFIFFLIIASPTVAADKTAFMSTIKDQLLQRSQHFSVRQFSGAEWTPRAISITTKNSTIQTFTKRIYVNDALLENNIYLDDLDLVTPDKNSRILPGLAITVIDVEKKVETRQETIPFVTQYQEDSTLPVGQEKILQAGVDGERIVEYEITLHDDQEYKRTELSQTILQAAVPRIVACRYQYLESGEATYYGKSWTLDKFLWRKWAQGSNLFAAHKTLPIGTKVLVVNDYPGKYYGDSVVVTIIDRGPWGEGRVIDLSYWAFDTISNPAAGSTPVKLYKVADPDPDL